MSAREYRARADAMVASADAASSYEQVLQAETLASEWRQLAQVAIWQDALIAALADCGIETPPAPLQTPEAG